MALQSPKGKSVFPSLAPAVLDPGAALLGGGFGACQTFQNELAVCLSAMQIANSVEICLFTLCWSAK